MPLLSQLQSYLPGVTRCYCSVTHAGEGLLLKLLETYFVIYVLVAICNSYTMGTSGLPDIYTRTVRVLDC